MRILARVGRVEVYGSGACRPMGSLSCRFEDGSSPKGLGVSCGVGPVTKRFLPLVGDEISIRLHFQFSGIIDVKGEIVRSQAPS